MVGIYKITNKLNNNCYIGQSKNIDKRWQNEKNAAFNQNDKSYDYPLSRAFRKYGIKNFNFEIIEECTVEELNFKENYWINYFQPVYNQTKGGDYQAHGKLTLKEIQEIQNILTNDTNGNISHIELANKYGVSPDTIQGINAGRIWFNSSLEYPLHLSKYDFRRIKEKKYCIDCGCEIFKTSTRCQKCENIFRKNKSKNNNEISREELKEKIRNQSFISIGKEFGITDNAIRKWCIKYGLPSKKKDINAYSDEEWLNI